MLREEYSKCLEDNNQLRDNLASEELLNQQLLAQFNGLKLDEKEKKCLIREHNRLKQEYVSLAVQ